MLGVVAAIIGFLTISLREPRSGGRSLSEWLAFSAGATTLSQIDTARSAIREFGPKAVPYLLDWLEETAPNYERGWRRVVQNIEKKIRIQQSKEFRINRNMAIPWAFGVLGPDGESAILTLFALLNSERSGHAGYSAALSLGKFGSVATPYLSVAMNSTNAETRRRALSGAGYLGTNAIPMLDRIIEAFSDEDPRCAQQAEVTLRFLDCPADTIVARLARYLETDFAGRDRAANVVAYYSNYAQSAIPALERALSDRNPVLREAASRSLSRIRPQPDTAPEPALEP